MDVFIYLPPPIINLYCYNSQAWGIRNGVSSPCRQQGDESWGIVIRVNTCSNMKTERRNNNFYGMQSRKIQ
jgi:hypothetical protein